MKKILAMMILAVVAVIAPAVSFATNPQLKSVENELNAQLPTDMGDGLILKKVSFPDDGTFELHITAADLAGFSKSDIGNDERQAFREAFLGELGPDNEFVQLCSMTGMKLRIVVYNPAGQEVIRETFTSSDF